MKTNNRPATSKLVIRFDNELKNILTNDLKSFLDKNPFFARNKQANMRTTLYVA
jgi:hypothetical protein